MKAFIVAILREWHIFSQTKVVTIFRNIFIIYNNNIKDALSFEELAHSYGLFSIQCNILLYDDLCSARLSTKFSGSPNSDLFYLHKCDIYRSQFESFIREMGDNEFSYKEAYNRLLELYDINTAPKTDDSGVKETHKLSYLANRGQGWGTDPDDCVVYHSDIQFQPESKQKSKVDEDNEEEQESLTQEF